MSELSLLAPAIVAAALCAFGLASLYWFTHNRPVFAPPSDQTEEAQDILPFDELKTDEELRAAVRANRLKEREPQPHL